MRTKSIVHILSLHGLHSVSISFESDWAELNAMSGVRQYSYERRQQENAKHQSKWHGHIT